MLTLAISEIISLNDHIKADGSSSRSLVGGDAAAPTGSETEYFRSNLLPSLSGTDLLGDCAPIHDRVAGGCGGWGYHWGYYTVCLIYREVQDYFTKDQ